MTRAWLLIAVLAVWAAPLQAQDGVPPAPYANVQLADPAQQSNAAQVRALLGTLDELQLMRELGEYKPGVSPHYDRAVAIEPALDAFLRQAPQEVSTLPRTREALHALVH